MNANVKKKLLKLQISPGKKAYTSSRLPHIPLAQPAKINHKVIIRRTDGRIYIFGRSKLTFTNIMTA